MPHRYSLAFLHCPTPYHEPLALALVLITAPYQYPLQLSLSLLFLTTHAISQREALSLVRRTTPRRYSLSAHGIISPCQCASSLWPTAIPHGDSLPLVFPITMDTPYRYSLALVTMASCPHHEYYPS